MSWQLPQKTRDRDGRREKMTEQMQLQPVDLQGANKDCHGGQWLVFSLEPNCKTGYRVLFVVGRVGVQVGSDGQQR